uniref:Uncharacterized protein n=1 Tax=Tetraselmis sp. GSL018 TaxID=582737 RepID=A0A061S4G8_9CHLO|mmetsp:Transcript_918/g.2195  ORF Transcript_918/g.2195 Transcript_918/m.2195 type:complete len:214 (-) Transcript_918:235-876(-)|eukprot:CAMPEP_0177605088 /NCGR_PEP_ID=MMETSP0419_2-20121207/16498_1 /TAXON_ID=582737 /ORGANISM="Tetraselmis sp., Strain GSL018" /LENGTH=213 /DNA_ID=CAMNT_0019099181 /DNA_START=185 /DNA_END=826 /DNA_ORIENTATION=-
MVSEHSPTRQAPLSAKMHRLGRRDLQKVCEQLREKKRKNTDAIRESLTSRRDLTRPQPNGIYSLPSGWEALTLEKAELFYKVVAIVGDRMFSVFDGLTEYRLGHRLSSRRGVGEPLGWPPVDSCYFASSTPEQAVNTEFPRNSALLAAPKLLIQVQAEGRAYKNASLGLWALSHVTPTLLLSDVTEGSSFVISARYISPPRKQPETAAEPDAP